MSIYLQQLQISPPNIFVSVAIIERENCRLHWWAWYSPHALPNLQVPSYLKLASSWMNVCHTVYVTFRDVMVVWLCRSSMIMGEAGGLTMNGLGYVGRRLRGFLFFKRADIRIYCRGICFVPYEHEVFERCSFVSLPTLFRAFTSLT